MKGRTERDAIRGGTGHELEGDKLIPLKGASIYEVCMEEGREKGKNTQHLQTNRNSTYILEGKKSPKNCGRHIWKSLNLEFRANLALPTEKYGGSFLIPSSETLFAFLP